MGRKGASKRSGKAVGLRGVLVPLLRTTTTQSTRHVALSMKTCGVVCTRKRPFIGTPLWVHVRKP
jgi:hypothetical protein